MNRQTEQEKIPQKQHISNPIVQAIINEPYSATDPNGSYTGKPKDKNEVPVQDADDL